MIVKFIDDLSRDVEPGTSLHTDIEEITALHGTLIDDKKGLRSFIVRFKSGHTRVVWPSSNDPLQFEQRIAPVYEIAGERIQVT
jgi:hypothetical protein